MNNVKKENLSKSLAIILSLAIHALLLLGAYYLPLRYGYKGASTPYRIKLDLKTFQESLTQPTPAITADKVQAVTSMASEKLIVEKTIPQKATVSRSADEAGQKAVPPELAQENSSMPLEKEETVIDKRGLYKVAEDKKTGTSLELVGWIWDSVPHPQDDTNEVGKLVFEIIIDDTGEILAVKTLEKTVSPLVEQLYKDEVAKLTFSKTNKNMTYAATSVGKITFILQYK